MLEVVSFVGQFAVCAALVGKVKTILLLLRTEYFLQVNAAIIVLSSENYVSRIAQICCLHRVISIQLRQNRCAASCILVALDCLN